MKSEAAEEEATEALDRALVVGATLLWLLLVLLAAAEEVVDEADEDKESRPDEIDNSLLCC